jgi:uncharacterized protein (DUF1684 family)
MSTETSRIDELADFRREKDRVFVEHPQSPLTHEQRHSFQGLKYFPATEALVIDGGLEPPSSHDHIRLQTTTGDEQDFHRAGKIHFEVEGLPATLTLFGSHASEDLFLPFRDATSGHETYGAGRYIDVEAPHDGRVTVDFNLAYNPYCAYNPSYSCPLPPRENWLEVPIRAGELAYEADPH